MSAKNWTDCPKCKRRAEEKAAKLKKRAADAYGKVEPEEYAEMLEKARTVTPQKNTLREDYHLGVSQDGMFSVRYHAGCAVCDFKYEYDYSAKL